jgi:hypothetical protein
VTPKRVKVIKTERVYTKGAFIAVMNDLIPYIPFEQIQQGWPYLGSRTSLVRLAQVSCKQ